MLQIGLLLLATTSMCALCHILAAACTAVSISYPVFVSWERSHPLLYCYRILSRFLFLPGHLDNVNYISVHLGHKVRICSAVAIVCEYARTLSAALHLRRIRTRLINKRTVFIGRKLCGQSETPCRHRWKRKRRLQQEGWFGRRAWQ